MEILVNIILWTYAQGNYMTTKLTLQTIVHMLVEVLHHSHLLDHTITVNQILHYTLAFVYACA